MLPVSGYRVHSTTVCSPCRVLPHSPAVSLLRHPSDVESCERLVLVLDAEILRSRFSPPSSTLTYNVPPALRSTLPCPALPCPALASPPSPSIDHLSARPHPSSPHVPVNTGIAAAWLPIATTATIATHDREHGLVHARRQPGHTSTTQPLETV